MLSSAGSNPENLRDLLQSESDFGVLRLMADKDRAWVNAAVQEFYDRHKDYLWKTCADVAENLGCDAWVEDVFQDTFHCAWKTAGKFEFPECPKDDEDNVVKGWLGQIARNLLCDRWRKTRYERTRTDAQWAALAEKMTAARVDSAEEPTLPKDEPEARQLDEAMETLTDREAHVLRVTSQFHRLGKKFQRLPNGIVDELAETFNTTPENLRKIRERAKRKVRQYVEERRGKTSP